MAGPTIEELMAKYEGRFRAAFLSAIREIVSQARIKEISDALARGDVQGALDKLYIEPAAFNVFTNEIRASFGEGGMQAVQNLGPLTDAQGNRLVFRFDVRNLVAEQWITERSSEFITNIVDEQRIVIREHLRAGLQRGDNPRTTALDVVGRINKATGRREGGVIGLSIPQEQYVRNARSELQNKDFSAYLQRKLRDKRFDRTVARALAADEDLSPAQIAKIVNRYADRLLKHRGDTIARTETLAALNAAAYQSLQQLVDSGKIQADQITRVWDSAGDARVRNTHRIADGQRVGFDEDFVMASGRRLRYPGDPKGGASEVINCRCIARTEIDFSVGVT